MSLRVLVVDDTPAVLRTLRAMVSGLGYGVLVAETGEAAVRVFGEHTGPVTAVVLDVELPGMDGPATLAALRVLDPELPCVFVTGQSPRYAAEELAALDAWVLAKPVRLGDLAAVLRSATAGDVP